MKEIVSQKRITVFFSPYLSCCCAMRCCSRQKTVYRLFATAIADTWSWHPGKIFNSQPFPPVLAGNSNLARTTVSRPALCSPILKIGVTLFRSAAYCFMDAQRNNAKGPQLQEGKATQMEGPDLESVIERARGHDAEALGEIYRLYVRRVFGLCRYMLDSRESAFPPAKSSSSCSAPSRATTGQYRSPGGCCGWLATNVLTLCGAASVAGR